MNTTLRDPLLGQVLDGRYRVEARIAVGGMATVYRALDTRLDRVLALKVMHPSLAVDAEFVERFIREAKAVARLDHPNIVGVHDQSADGAYVYLAMEYVAGCTLRDVLRDTGALPPRAVLDLMEPVLAGLGAAHRAGLVHRDMKPENVLIGDDGRVKVADFGLVRGVDTQTSAATGSLLGTLSYLAPEQIEHGTVGTRADVYACGIMLYELLTGAKPHTGDSAAQVLLAHVNRDVPPPSEAVAGLAAELDALVAGATSRTPAARPPDAAALLSRLRAARAVLTEGQLDTAPPRRAETAAGRGRDAAGPEDVTSVVPLPPGVTPAHGTDRTARFALPEVPQAPPAAGRRRPLPRRAVWALVLAVLAVLGTGAGLWYINSGQFTRTPGVYGVPQAEAEQTLREAGLGVRVTEDFSPTVERGHVISTDPQRGDRIRRNAAVTVVVSRGPEVVTVPELEGVPVEEAQQQLTEAGLTPGTESTEFHEDVPQGAVIRTDPPAGQERRPDSAVALVVSRGVEIDVPDVTGEAEGTAIQQLDGAGFEVDVHGERVHSVHPEGTVAEQSPDGGGTAAVGDTVTLTISKGPEMIEVPDVRGMREREARETLEEAGFEVSVRRYFVTGTVFNQSVHSGDTAERGSTIIIHLR
ncbi:Stk1 family PASTA domain-containing Ser/Thr kinase [Streptomyces sp. ACA25]|uniref:Stk1 family PASTA domain-containing Ser/Thr kinase n=1 Tax=Streptomyces sp. ACA25 TaxID=3022596 RepID=UPI0023071288|nr:Stk1 family PASTA domain-containing Ser/Thr kinase [Streptomyces sp. ACA25]MDB1089891.1 Stk1 family PASTA domain-containing Ser/Thr kinase [Streptomyces sp. ACA25]